MRRCPSWTKTMATITASATKGIITTKTWSGLVHQASIPPGSLETIEAKIISEMPLPIPRWVISSPNHISSVQPAVSAITIRRTFGPVRLPSTLVPPCFGAEGPEEEDVAEGLAEGQADGQVARVLGDLLLADLAFFLELLQRGDDDREQLQDDRRGDVGHDPQREEREAREAAAREEVEEAEDVGAAEVALQFLDGVDVDARRRDVGAQPVEREHRRGEGEFLANVGDAESVRNGPEH